MEITVYADDCTESLHVRVVTALGLSPAYVHISPTTRSVWTPVPEAHNSFSMSIDEYIGAFDRYFDRGTLVHVWIAHVSSLNYFANSIAWQAMGETSFHDLPCVDRDLRLIPSVQQLMRNTLQSEGTAYASEHLHLNHLYAFLDILDGVSLPLGRDKSMLLSGTFQIPSPIDWPNTVFHSLQPTHLFPHVSTQVLYKSFPYTPIPFAHYQHTTRNPTIMVTHCSGRVFVIASVDETTCAFSIPLPDTVEFRANIEQFLGDVSTLTFGDSVLNRTFVYTPPVPWDATSIPLLAHVLTNHPYFSSVFAFKDRCVHSTAPEPDRVPGPIRLYFRNPCMSGTAVTHAPFVTLVCYQYTVMCTIDPTADWILPVFSKLLRYYETHVDHVRALYRNLLAMCDPAPIQPDIDTSFQVQASRDPLKSFNWARKCQPTNRHPVEITAHIELMRSIRQHGYVPKDADFTLMRSLESVGVQQDASRTYMAIEEEKELLNKYADLPTIEFPKNSGRHWVCVDPATPFPSVIENVRSPVGYQLACFRVDKSHTAEYRTYYNDDAPTQRTLSTYLVTTDKLLDTNTLGTLPAKTRALPNLIYRCMTTVLAGTLQPRVYRCGVDKGPNSFMHCLNRAFGRQVQRAELVRIHACMLRQELFDVPSDTGIEMRMHDTNTFLDPRIFVRVLEMQFQCNIVIFQRDDACVQGDIQVPFSYGPHVRFDPNPALPTIFIYMHNGSESDMYVGHHCELLFLSCDTLKHTSAVPCDAFQFPHTHPMTQFVWTVYKRLPNVRFVAPPSSTDPIVAQWIDTYGKRRANILYYNNQFTVHMCDAGPPLNLPAVASVEPFRTKSCDTSGSLQEFTRLQHWADYIWTHTVQRFSAWLEPTRIAGAPEGSTHDTRLAWSYVRVFMQHTVRISIEGEQPNVIPTSPRELVRVHMDDGPIVVPSRDVYVGIAIRLVHWYQQHSDRIGQVATQMRWYTDDDLSKYSRQERPRGGYPSTQIGYMTELMGEEYSE